MKPAWWMAGASVASWLAATAVVETRTGFEILFGMLGPLAAAVGTWVLAVRAFRLGAERVTPLMVAAFGMKMVFFGAYVAVMLRLLSLRPIPFMTSFTTYFIALHLTEALCLRRLFADGAPAAR